MLFPRDSRSHRGNLEIFPISFPKPTVGIAARRATISGLKVKLVVPGLL